MILLVASLLNIPVTLQVLILRLFHVFFLKDAQELSLILVHYIIILVCFIIISRLEIYSGLINLHHRAFRRCEYQVVAVRGIINLCLFKSAVGGHCKA